MSFNGGAWGLDQDKLHRPTHMQTVSDRPILFAPRLDQPLSRRSPAAIFFEKLVCLPFAITQLIQ